MTISPDNPNLIGYLNVILKYVVDYIDENNKNSLITKLNEFITSDYINNENKNIIHNFIISMKENNIDLFCDTLELFNNFNGEIEFTQSTYHKLG